MLDGGFYRVSDVGGSCFQDVPHPPRWAFAGEPLVQSETTHRNGVHPFHWGEHPVGDAWIELHHKLCDLTLMHEDLLADGALKSVVIA